MRERLLFFFVLELFYFLGLDLEWGLSLFFLSRVGFRLDGRREDVRLSEVIGLCEKLG